MSADTIYMSQATLLAIKERSIELPPSSSTITSWGGMRVEFSIGWSVAYTWTRITWTHCPKKTLKLLSCRNLNRWKSAMWSFASCFSLLESGSRSIQPSQSFLLLASQEAFKSRSKRGRGGGGWPCIRRRDRRGFTKSKMKNAFIQVTLW